MARNTDTTSMSSKRTYAVLRKIDQPGDARVEPWDHVADIQAANERAAIQAAIVSLAEALQSGTFVAVARFRPLTVTAKTVSQTKLEWS